MQSTDYNILQQGENALLINWPQRIDPEVNQLVMAAFRRIHGLQLRYVRDLIPAYASLTIVYDTMYIFRNYDSNVTGWISARIHEVLRAPGNDAITAKRSIDIPVCYDPSLGLDILALAAQKQLSLEELVALHTGRTYIVYMLGFLPGFPYMGTVDPRLVAPRLSKPRQLVPAGSVGIAGEQTGVYPLDSPGGWNIIGQTPVRMFDAENGPASYCQPGDEVTFVPISLDEFSKMKTVK